VRRLIELPLIFIAAFVLVGVLPLLVPVPVPLLPVVPLLPLVLGVPVGETTSEDSEVTEPAETAASAVTIVPGGFCPAGKLALGVIARAWKAEKVLFAFALIEKTIPASQCVLFAVVCPQKNQRGLVLFSMVILQVGKVGPSTLVTFWNPELTPLAVQGLAKEDWVTEWFLETNWKETISPFWTLVRLLGVNVNVSFWPTMTFHVVF